jgi:hypothetical protein
VCLLFSPVQKLGAMLIRINRRLFETLYTISIQFRNIWHRTRSRGFSGSEDLKGTAVPHPPFQEGVEITIPNTHLESFCYHAKIVIDQ